ncbi:MAG: hypothetical protein QNI85_00735 [Desulfobacterales bacterium]|nr:hypothetical protein [Desulfobacterales bacterium]
MQLPPEGHPGEEFDPGDALVSLRNITVNVLFSPRTLFAAFPSAHRKDLRPASTDGAAAGHVSLSG